MSHKELIRCPKCADEQMATVLHTLPWNTYIHTCASCQYIIMESEWQRIQTLEPRPEETIHLTKTVLQGSADESEKNESLKNVPGAGVREFDPDEL